MTCIVGLSVGGVAVVGADSAGVGGWDLTVRGDAKVFKRGAFVIGFTTSFRMGQILRYKLPMPEHPVDMDAHEFMATRFVDAVRECLKAGGFAKRDSEREEGGSFVVAYQRRIFVVYDDYQVAMPLVGYAAVGSGAQVALGHLHATQRIANMSCADRVRAALEAAEQFNAGVRGPFALEVDADAKVLSGRGARGKARV